MEKNARYSETVKGDFRTYFFDLKQSEKGNPYLLITESRKSKESEGEFERDRILIFPADLDKFAEALGSVIQHHKEKVDTPAG
ncbi:MAG: DUF3276 family protein [Phaeodactylibacter sp.]|nr:DUF3276 family protein [Phaeodactylibacter sp.]MCB9047975.1 DUF3276 family protein [Lewinellaceae bacterium]